MPPLVELHFWPSHDLKGTSLGSVTSDDDFFEALTIQPRLRSLGGGSIAVSRDIGDERAGLMSAESFVRVLIPSVHANKYLWGFFVNQRDQTLVSQDERGGEGFTIGGLGPMFYLSRAILWDEKFSSSTKMRAHPDDGVMVFNDSVTAGDVLNVLFDDDNDNTIAQFLPDLSLGFDDALTSGGVSWGSDYQMGADFELEMGSSYLDNLWQIQDGIKEPLDFTVDLGTVAQPKFELNAWKTYGRDLTGTDFGAGVVLLREGVNLEDEFEVGGRGHSPRNQSSGTALRKATHALAIGKDGTYGRAEKTSYSPGEYAKAVSIDYSNSGQEDVLERAGLRWLRHQQDADQEFLLTIRPGFDDTVGDYFPGFEDTDGHVWLGDTVTLKTGETVSSNLEFEFAPQWVTGVDLTMRDAARDSNGAKSWDVKLLLNVDRGSDNSQRLSGNGAGLRGRPGRMRLCRPGVLGEEPSISRLYLSGRESGNSGESQANDGPNLNSTHLDAAWETNAASFNVFALYTTPQSTVNGAVSWDQTDEAEKDVALVGGVYPLTTGSDLLAVMQNGGTIRGQFRMKSRSGVGINEASQNNLAAMDVRVWRPGVGSVGTNLAVTTVGDLKFATSGNTNRTFPETAFAGVGGAANGDYLLVTLGAHHIAPTGGGTGAAIFRMDDAASDLPEDQVTTTNLNSWIEIISAGGDILSEVNDGHPLLIGDSPRAKRCDDTEHFFATRPPNENDDFATAGMRYGTHWVYVDDLDDATESFGSWMLIDASEGAAVWIQMSLGSVVGPHTHTTSDITDLNPDTPVVADHGAMGATEDFDVTDGNDHEGILDEDLTVTLSGATDGEAAWLTLILTQDGTGGNSITWPGSVVWPGGVAPVIDEDADAATIVSLVTYDGGTNWYGAFPGVGSTSSGGGGLPLTGVVNGDPVLIWDFNNSLVASE